jgi:hypothetical protein
MEEAMRHFYLEAMIEKSTGEHADWVDAAMIQAASIARDVAAYRKLSAERLAGEFNQGPADGATLDEWLDRIRAELNVLGPILEMEIVREPGPVESRGWLDRDELRGEPTSRLPP